jgi:FlaA1/EpsC-like NDP-sugar epimerase
MDILLSLSSYFMALQLRFEFSVPVNEWMIWVAFIPILLLVRAATYVGFKTYSGVIRHTSSRDAQRIFWALTSGSVLIALASWGRWYWGDGLFFIPFSILAIEWLGTLVAMIAVRLGAKWIYLQSRRPTGERAQVAIFGAGEAGLYTKQAIDREGIGRMQVVAFVDDAPGKAGKKLDGIDILSAREAERAFSSGRVDRLILSVQNLDPIRKRQLVDLALQNGVRILDVPPFDHWINGELSFRQLRELRIEDLLGRPAIVLDNDLTEGLISGKRVAITGAAGSIGSELVRQVLSFGPERVLAVDVAETPLHDLEREIDAVGASTVVEWQIGDIRSPRQVRETLGAFRPDVVFHAAAYKHVPMMERQPWQSFHTNILGTKNVVEAAVEAGASTLVCISTDKAVKPSSVMGATKSVAEHVALAYTAGTPMRCIITRFGNVLGSNGSVIPIFKSQIASGGPVTVTDSDVTRYFMTIPEAVQLVLTAGSMGDGRDIFVFDMGKSVKIVDLAHKMIRLSGLEPGVDIEVKITGLRPGEKLHEELFAETEVLLPTPHPKIHRASPAPLTADHLMAAIEDLAQHPADHARTRDTLQRLLPEYTPETRFELAR